MKSLEERIADRQRRKALAERENSPAPQQLRPQDQLAYGDMKVPQLRDLVDQRGLDVPKKASRAEMIAALEQDDSNSNQDEVETQTSAVPPVPTVTGNPWGQQ